MGEKNNIWIKLIILFFAMWIIYSIYPCILDKGDKCLLPVMTSSIVFTLFVILAVGFMVVFLFENPLKLFYYILEFIILIVGIYGVILIKEILESGFANFFKITAMILIFIFITILLDLRKILSKKI